MSPFALAGPAMPDGTKRSKDTLGLTAEHVSGVPPRGRRCASLRLIARRWPFSGIAAVERQYAVAGRREP